MPQWQSGRKKKLAEAGRHWARGGRREDARRTYAEDKKALLEAGVSEADAETALAARKPEDGDEGEVCWLWQANVEALDIFCALETQWQRSIGLVDVRLGLIYSEATNLMRERGIRRARRAELLEDIRVMEKAALEVLNKRGDDDA